jgi:hypothetical protein
LRSKKGAYFFVMDAIFAGIILVTALFYIFSSYSIKPETDTAFRTTEDFANFLFSTTIRQYNSVYIWQLVNSSNITNLDTRLSDQMIIFYHRNQTSLLTNFTRDVASITVPSDRGLIIYINGTNIYNSTNHKNPSTLNTSRLSYTTKRMAFTKINQSTLYGPTWIEVNIWI